MKKALIILNPFAGTKKANRVLTDIISEIQKGGYNVSVHITEGKGDGEEYSFAFSKFYDLIIAVGGDGTFNEVASGMFRANSASLLGYIPAGSTNDFAASLNLKTTPTKAAKDIIEGEIRKIDLGLFNSRPFAYVASFGAFTSVSYSTPQDVKNSLGHIAYVFEGIKDISNIKGKHIQVKTDDRVFSGKYSFGAISNTTSLGGVLKISPEMVDMNDGLLEVMLIKEPQTLNDLTQILNALNTKNYSTPMIDFCSTTKAEIIAEEEMIWTLDGERQDGSSVIKIKNVRDAINLIVPKK